MSPAEIAIDPDEDLFHAKAYAMWDKRFVYVAFEVEDDTPMQNGGDDPFLAFKSGDTVEVFICTDPKADPDRHEPIISDYRILMTYLKNTKPVVYGYHPISKGTPRYISHPTGAWKTRMDESGEIKHASFSIKRREDNSGYGAEASIPWSYFDGFRPASGLKLPFNFAINFSDSSGRNNMAKAWWSGGGTMVTDISIELKLNTDIWGYAIFK